MEHDAKCREAKSLSGEGDAIIECNASDMLCHVGPLVQVPAMPRGVRASPGPVFVHDQSEYTCKHARALRHELQACNIVLCLHVSTPRTWSMPLLWLRSWDLPTETASACTSVGTQICQGPSWI